MINPAVQIQADVILTRSSGPGMWIGLIDTLGGLVPVDIDQYVEESQPVVAEIVQGPLKYTY